MLAQGLTIASCQDRVDPEEQHVSQKARGGLRGLIRVGLEQTISLGLAL